VFIPLFPPSLTVDLSTAKNPDARKPTSPLGRASVALGSLLHFFITPKGLFALRYALLSLALWVPAVVPRTAWFYYANKVTSCP
jgi:hypothetical protein